MNRNWENQQKTFFVGWRYVYMNLKRSHFWGFSFGDTAVFPKLGQKYGFAIFNVSDRGNTPFLNAVNCNSIRPSILVEIFTLFEAESCLLFTQKLQSYFSQNFVFQKFNFKVLYLWEFCTSEATLILFRRYFPKKYETHTLYRYFLYFIQILCREKIIYEILLMFPKNAILGAKSCKTQKKDVKCEKVPWNTVIHCLFFAFCEHFMLFCEKCIASLSVLHEIHFRKLAWKMALLENFHPTYGESKCPIRCFHIKKFYANTFHRDFKITL